MWHREWGDGLAASALAGGVIVAAGATLASLLGEALPPLALLKLPGVLFILLAAFVVAFGPLRVPLALLGVLLAFVPSVLLFATALQAWAEPLAEPSLPHAARPGAQTLLPVLGGLLVAWGAWRQEARGR